MAARFRLSRNRMGTPHTAPPSFKEEFSGFAATLLLPPESQQQTGGCLMLATSPSMAAATQAQSDAPKSMGEVSAFDCARSPRFVHDTKTAPTVRAFQSHFLLRDNHGQTERASVLRGAAVCRRCVARSGSYVGLSADPRPPCSSALRISTSASANH